MSVQTKYRNARKRRAKALKRLQAKPFNLTDTSDNDNVAQFVSPKTDLKTAKQKSANIPVVLVEPQMVESQEGIGLHQEKHSALKLFKHRPMENPGKKSAKMAPPKMLMNKAETTQNYPKSNNNSEPTSPFDMNYGSDDMEAEMGNFFIDFSK